MKTFLRKGLCIFVLALLATMLLVGCGDSDVDEYGRPRVIRIGLTIDDNDPFAGDVNQRFMDALSEHIGIPVQGVPDVTYLVAIEAMRGGNLEIATMSSFNFVQASRAMDGEIEILVHAPFDDTSRTQFITRADNDAINSIEDLRGNTFAFVNHASTSGFMFPAYYLVAQLGLNPDLLSNSGYFFSSVAMSGAHDASVMGVLLGDFDAAAVFNGQIPNMAEAGLINPDDIKVIGETRPFPIPAYAIRSGIPADLIQEIREFMLAWDDEEYFEAVWNVWGGDGNTEWRYSVPNPESFAYVESMMISLGMDID